MKDRNLDEDIPNILFLHEDTLLLALYDFLKQISIICILHYDTKYSNLVPQALRGFIKKSLFILDDVCVPHAGEYSDFVKGVLFFFVR